MNQWLQSLSVEVGVSNENDRMDGDPWYNKNVECLSQRAWMLILKQVWFKVLPTLPKKLLLQHATPTSMKIFFPTSQWPSMSFKKISEHCSPSNQNEIKQDLHPTDS